MNPPQPPNDGPSREAMDLHADLAKGSHKETSLECIDRHFSLLRAENARLKEELAGLTKPSVARMANKSSLLDSFLESDVLKARFASLVNGLPEECWPWKGHKNAKGYGLFSLKGKNLMTHRIAFLIHNKKINHRLFVLHNCDNPACCNPAHLWQGSGHDNMRDMADKGRGKGARKHSVISEEQALLLINEYKQGGISLEKLGVKYGHSTSVVWRVTSGQTFRHLSALAAQTAPTKREEVL